MHKKVTMEYGSSSSYNCKGCSLCIECHDEIICILDHIGFNLQKNCPLSNEKGKISIEVNIDREK